MRLLFLVHGLPPREVSGSPLQAHGYATALSAAGHDVTVATVDDRIGRPEPATLETHPTGGYRVAAFAGTHAQWTDWAQSDWQVAARNPGARDRPFKKLLAKVQPDLVHVLDLVHLPSEWPRLAAAQGIPVVRTFCNAEDLCGMIEPIHDGSGRCATPIVPGECANHCARQRSVTMPATRTTIGRLADRVAELVQQHEVELTGQLEHKRAELIHDLEHTYAASVFATAAWRDHFARSVPLAADRTTVIPLGMAPRTPPVDPPASARPLTFGFLAQPTQNKGFDVLFEVARDPRIQARRDIRFRVHASWPAGGEGEGVMRALPNVDLHAAFAPDELPDILATIDVGLCLSRFETFHRVTREFLQAGRPVVGSDAPGIGEILRHEDNGLATPGGDVEAVVRAVLRLADDAELLATCRAGAAATTVPGPDDELSALEDLYDSLCSSAEHPDG